MQVASCIKTLPEIRAHEVECLQLQASNHKIKGEQCAERDEYERKVLELMLGRFTTNTLHLRGRTQSSEELVKVLDQDQCVPHGWDKCLDLKNGGVYYVNSSTGNRSSSYSFSFPKRETTGIDSRRRDYEELDLRLSLSCDSAKQLSTPATDASTVTSLGKRDHGDSYSFSESSNFCANSYSCSSARSSCTSSEATGKSNKRSGKTLKTNKDDTELAVMMLVGCPTCLMYVMTSRQDTKCPRCKSSVLFNFLPGNSPSKRIRTV